MSEEFTLEQLVEKSNSTDASVLLTVKEQAKRAMLEDPTSRAAIDAFEKASRNLSLAMQGKDEKLESLKNWQAVLDYVAEGGRKLGRNKLYKDIEKGLLKRQPDKTFRVKDVEVYMESLQTLGTPDGLAEKAADRKRRKDEADIRKTMAAAMREELKLAEEQGKVIDKELLHLELAARAIALRDGLHTAAEMSAPDIIELVHGDPQYTPALLDLLGRIFDEKLGEYSRPLVLDVKFQDLGGEFEEEDEE